MEEAAVGSPRAGANGRNRRALEAVTVEHRQSRGQQILSRASDHDQLSPIAPRSATLEQYSRSGQVRPRAGNAVSRKSIGRSAARAVRRAGPAAMAARKPSRPGVELAAPGGGAGVADGSDCAVGDGGRHRWRRRRDRRNRIGPQRRGFAVLLRRIDLGRLSDLPSPDGLAASSCVASLELPWQFPCRLPCPFPWPVSLFGVSSFAASLLPAHPWRHRAWAARRACPACSASAWQPICGRRDRGRSRPVAAQPFGPGGLLGRRRAYRAAEAVELLGGCGLRILRPAGSGLATAGIGRAVGNQKGAELRGHLARGGVMLAQKALQAIRPARSSGDPARSCGRRCRCLKKSGKGSCRPRDFCARTGIAARQPIRSVTVAKLSARLNILIVLQMRNWLPSVPNPARVAAVTF